MSVLVNKSTKVITQGFTGQQGTFHSEQALDYGTKFVGGVTPGRAGRDVYGVPVYDCVRDITAKTQVDGSIVTVPPRFTRDAVFEAIDAGIKLVVIVTERIPRAEVAQMVEFAKLRGARIIGIARRPGQARGGAARGPRRGADARRGDGDVAGGIVGHRLGHRGGGGRWRWRWWRWRWR